MQRPQARVLWIFALVTLARPIMTDAAGTKADVSGAVAAFDIEARIPLGDVAGRIDHLALDPTRRRLYVAELGNDSVAIVDLETRRLVRTVTGLAEPQGLGYEPATDAVYVANGADGSVRVFRGGNFAPLGVIELGQDADNVRIDGAASLVYVGYGKALAVIDPTKRRRIADIALKGHPESFQLDPSGPNIFVNVPDAQEIAVVARDQRRVGAHWPTSGLSSNFPMAIDAESGRVIVIFRHPARLEAFDVRDGRRLAGADVCADADDVFVDAKRRRVHVICGEGFVDTFEQNGTTYVRVARLVTSPGSRTGLFVPALDRLFVAIRATRDQPAAVWLLRPGA